MLNEFLKKQNVHEKNAGKVISEVPATLKKHTCLSKITQIVKGSESEFPRHPPYNSITITRHEHASTFPLSWAKEQVWRAATGSMNSKTAKLHCQLVVTCHLQSVARLIWAPRAQELCAVSLSWCFLNQRVKVNARQQKAVTLESWAASRSKTANLILARWKICITLFPPTKCIYSKKSISSVAIYCCTLLSGSEKLHGKSQCYTC